MKKLILGIIMMLTLYIFLGCGSTTSRNNTEELTKTEAEKVISNYLNALSKKDLKAIRKYGTDEYTIGFNKEFLNLLKETLEYAKLLNCEIENSTEEKALINTEVEVVCYENASPTGDWVPGKSISNKSFELVKVNNKWKVNGWGVY